MLLKFNLKGVFIENEYTNNNNVSINFPSDIYMQYHVPPNSQRVETPNQEDMEIFIGTARTPVEPYEPKWGTGERTQKMRMLSGDSLGSSTPFSPNKAANHHNQNLILNPKNDFNYDNMVYNLQWDDI